ncbi:hydrogenase expression/synthesis HypA [Desulfovibrio sp. X2]|uniref:hydrogenase maturation nickel metallochaperone HypA n=1 Tax=Desulfovibrio sp. X2 TaxID=941449 RepID=UPI0003587D18|nr:hydrogenase maturation nickel metallochaperone HypA [Desulfovibrio sp. X2]EPR37391.1 hydrogenase expression/synthesis HypA [Desulfovibrio sp. X2]
MHESAIVAGIMRILEDEACRHGVARITRVRLQVGLLAAVEERTLSACFDLYAAGTVADGAELSCETTPMHGRCRVCGKECELTRRHFACPACGAAELDLSGGHELTIAAIEAQPQPQQGVRP